MSRIRATLLAALAGILITAGGCADSATAPTAATSPSLDRVQGDSVSASHRPVGEDDGPTTQGGGFMTGGSRS